MREQRKIPGFGRTRRLSSVMDGELPTARDEAETDQVEGLTYRQLYQLAETIGERKSRGLIIRFGETKVIWS